MMEQTELEIRKDALQGENRVFILNEGCCPKCFSDTEIINIGGLPDFHEEWAHVKCEKNYWATGPDFDHNTVGSIEWKCQNPECGAKHCVEQTKYGDWY